MNYSWKWNYPLSGNWSLSFLVKFVQSVQILIFEVLMVVNIKIMVFWNVLLCSLVGRHQNFRGTCCLNLHGRSVGVTLLSWRWRQQLLSKYWYLSTRLCGITSQNSILTTNLVLCHIFLGWYWVMFQQANVGTLTFWYITAVEGYDSN